MGGGFLSPFYILGGCTSFTARFWDFCCSTISPLPAWRRSLVHTCLGHHIPRRRASGMGGEGVTVILIPHHHSTLCIHSPGMGSGISHLEFLSPGCVYLHHATLTSWRRCRTPPPPEGGRRAPTSPLWEASLGEGRGSPGNFSWGCPTLPFSHSDVLWEGLHLSDSLPGGISHLRVHFSACLLTYLLLGTLWEGGGHRLIHSGGGCWEVLWGLGGGTLTHSWA